MACSTLLLKYKSAPGTRRTHIRTHSFTLSKKKKKMSVHCLYSHKILTHFLCLSIISKRFAITFYRARESAAQQNVMRFQQSVKITRHSNLIIEERCMVGMFNGNIRSKYGLVKCGEKFVLLTQDAIHLI